jgi:hypothetical protein
MSNGNDRDPAWWWKAAAGAMFAMLAGLLLKGCDQWQQTNSTLAQRTADVKYQIDRVGQREDRLNQLEKNVNLLFEKTVERFEQRRELADRLVNQIDERLDRLERYAPDGGRSPSGKR